MGIAQTKIEWEDPATGNDEQVLVRLSTNMPNEDVVYGWSDGGKFQSFSSASKEVTDAISKSGLEEIVEELRDWIAKEKQSNPNFDSSSISDDLLVQTLNTVSQWRGKNLVWTEKGGNAIENKNTQNPDQKPKNKKETVMVSGIKMSRDGEIITYKIGYDNQGVAKAVSYDNEGHAQVERNFARFIGDNFKSRTEKDPDYMDNLGSKEIGIKLQYYCSDPSIKWFGGDLTRDELKEYVEVQDWGREYARKKREEYNRRHRAEKRKQILRDILACIILIIIVVLIITSIK